MIHRVILKMINENQEQEFRIQKHNNFAIIHQKAILDLYYDFYQFENKSQKAKVYLDNKLIDRKEISIIMINNYIDIIEELKYKKGNMIYDYLNNFIYNYESLNKDMLIYDLSNIAEDIIKNSKLKLKYELEDDMEKIFSSCIDFSWTESVDESIKTFKLVLRELASWNTKVTYFIFFDKNVINFDDFEFDNCYFFNTSDNCDIKDCNLMSTKNEIREFTYESLENRIEMNWPIHFNQKEVQQYINIYFKTPKTNPLYVFNEVQLITYFLLNKYYDIDLAIENIGFTIHDNVKSFLEQF